MTRSERQCHGRKRNKPIVDRDSIIGKTQDEETEIKLYNETRKKVIEMNRLKLLPVCREEENEEN